MTGVPEKGCLSLASRPERAKGRSYKNFWLKFTHNFCKLDNFINDNNIVVGNLFAQMKTTLKKVLLFISDISSIRYNIRLTLMGKLATLL